jgi:hypothetical protein
LPSGPRTATVRDPGRRRAQQHAGGADVEPREVARGRQDAGGRDQARRVELRPRLAEELPGVALRLAGHEPEQALRVVVPACDVDRPARKVLGPKAHALAGPHRGRPAEPAPAALQQAVVRKPGDLAFVERAWVVDRSAVDDHDRQSRVA